MPNFHILIPKATQNLITNPSFENNTDGWVPEWTQEATFEDQELTPNPTGFDATAGVGANLAVINAAAIRGDFGFRVTVAGVGSEAYGTLNGPDNETQITVEFYFDPSNLTMANGDAFNFLEAMSPGAGGIAFRLLLDQAAGIKRFTAQLRDNVGGNVFPWTVNLSGAMQKFRIEWIASSAPGANDGVCNIYIDDVLTAASNTTDNDTHSVTSLEIGTTLNLDAGTFGSFDLDNIRWVGAITEFMGSSVERTLERARFGRYSTRVYTDGYSLNEGVYFRADTTNINELVSASVYLRGEGKLRIRIFDGLTGAESISKPLTINDNRWHRIEIRGRAVGGNDLRVYIETAETAQELIFYVDGAQLEEQEQATTYCDGEQQGCRWNGVSHASISERNAEEMSGGIWFPIREEGCSPDIYVTVISGFGVPPITLNRQRTASTPGSVFDSLKVEERTMQLIIWVKDEDVQKTRGLVLERLHELRQNLIDLVKPDISPDTEPFMLRYTDNGKSLTIRCRYNAGLEFDGDIRNKFTNTIPLRLLALDPYWEEDNQEVAILDSETVLGDDLPLIGRIDGAWEIVGQLTFNNVPLVVEEDANERLYMGGRMITSAPGVDYRYFGSINDDFTAFLERGSGLDDDVVAIVAHPNGNIYVAGFFLNDNAGNPLDQIAEYDPITDSFSALAGGIDDIEVHGLFVAPNGWVYAFGDFTTVDGQPMNSIAYWDGGGWHQVGDIIEEMGDGLITIWDAYVVSEDEIYVVGDGQFSASVLWRWDGAGWEVLAIIADGDAGSRGTSILRDSDGSFIIGGRKRSDAVTGAAALWRWNGSALTQLGEDLVWTATPPNSVISRIALTEEGNIVFIGRFDIVGNLSLDSPVALWNGSSFVFLDMITTNSPLFDATITVTRNGNLYVTPSSIFFDDVEASGFTNVLNISTTDVFPIISFTGTGKLIWLENQTTGQRIYLNYTLQENEILTLDFRNNTLVVTSNYRGNIPDAVLPNSDNFFLAPGKLNDPKENKIALLIIDEVEPTAQLRYVPVHWSIDAVAS